MMLAQVAVALDGTIYVADGYCNNRVVKFSAKGQYLGRFHPPGFYEDLVCAFAVWIVSFFQVAAFTCTLNRSNHSAFICYTNIIHSY